MSTYVALLRGINVGRNKRVAMADLRALLEERGFTDVRTLLQSGNVVLSSSKHSPAKVADEIAAAIQAVLGLQVGVVVRTAPELAEIVGANTLVEHSSDDSRLMVVFWAVEPAGARLPDLDAEAVLPERYVLAGRELYVWCPGGVLDSVVLKAFSDRQTGTVGTARNWRTVRKLSQLAL